MHEISMTSFPAPTHKPCGFEVSDKGSNFSRHPYYSRHAGPASTCSFSSPGSAGILPACFFSCGLEARAPREKPTPPLTRHPSKEGMGQRSYAVFISPLGRGGRRPGWVPLRITSSGAANGTRPAPGSRPAPKNPFPRYQTCAGRTGQEHGSERCRCRVTG